MAYGVRRYIQHIDDYGRTHRIEIQQQDYVGGTAAIKGNKEQGAFRFEHEDVTDEDGYLKVYANPIQKGMLEVYPMIESTADYGLLADIFQSDEQEFRLVWKISGSVYWTGYVLNDLLEFEESSYPYTSTIIAKDFSRLKGMDYPLTETRQTLITTIADLLGYLGLNLDIETATSWTESHLDTNADPGYDYLGEIYHETKALREFARTGDETDQPITVYEALKRMLSDNCLILKQINGKYKVDQLSAYADPTNVRVSSYTPAGVEISQSTLDKTVAYNRNIMRIKSVGSRSKGFVAIKRARVKFQHRTQVTNLQFPTAFQAVETFQQFFISDGAQELVLSGNCRARLLSENDSAEGQIIIQAGAYWWDDEANQWSASSVVNNFNLRIGHVGVDYKDFNGDFSFVTEPTPADADGQLVITFNNALGDMSGSSETEFSNVAFDIRNPIADQNSKYIQYQLTQQGGFSENYEHADSWFGDGPIQYSPGALRYGVGNADNTSDSWQRRGTIVGYRNFAQNQLKEIVDIQRSFVFRKEAAMWGMYNPTEILQYRGGNYYYTGGAFNGASGDWNVSIMDVNVQTGSDAFDDIPKFADESVQGSGASSPDPGGGGGGVTDHGALTGLGDDDHPQYFNQVRGDARYLNESENLSDLSNAVTAQSNLKLKDGTANLDLNSLIINEAEEGPRLTNGRTAAPRALTVQPTGGSGPGSVEVFPSGTGGRSHFLATNNNDLNNFGFVEFEVNGADAWMHAATKGTAPIGVDKFRFWNFSEGIRFENNVMIGRNTSPIAPLHIHHGQGDYTGIQVGNDIDASLDTGLYFNTTAVGQLHSDGEVRITGPDGVRLFSGNEFGDAHVTVFGNIQLGRYLDTSSQAANVTIQNFGDDTTVSAEFFADGHVEIPNNYLEFGHNLAWTTTNFATGFLGNGTRLYTSASEWTLETDVGFFRSALFAQEFIINQITATQGSRLASAGHGKVEVVNGTAPNEVVEVSDPEGNQYSSFVAGDIVMCMKVRADLDTETVNVLEDSGGVIVKRYVREVASVSGNEVTFTSTAGAPTDAGSIAVGDVIVVIGSTTSPYRSRLLYETVIEPNSPYTVLKGPVNSWADYKSPDKVLMKYGNLNQSYDYNSNTYGMAIGPMSGEHATFDPNKGVRFIDGNGVVGAQFNSSVFKLGVGSNYVEFDIDAGTGDIQVDSFRLQAGAELQINSNVPAIVTTDPATDDRVYLGMTHAPDLTQYDSFGINMINPTSGEEYFRLDSGQRHIAHWLINEVQIRGQQGDNIVDLFAETPAAGASIRMINTSNRVGATMGMGYWNGGWQDEFGFALTPNYTNANPWVQFTRNGATGDMTARIAGSYFDDAAMWGGDPVMSNGSIILNWFSSRISLPKASNGTRGWIDENGITLPSVSDQAINWALPGSAGISDASIYTDAGDMHIYGHGHIGNVRSITIEPNPDDFGYGLTNIGGMLTLYDKQERTIGGTVGAIHDISRSRMYISASGSPTITEMLTVQPLRDGMVLFITVRRAGSNMFFDYTAGGNIATRNDDPQELLPGGTLFFIYDSNLQRWSMQQDRN